MYSTVAALLCLRAHFCSPAYTEAGCTNTCKHSGCLLLLSRQDSTKGLLIERDIDLLTSISMKNPAICELTITTYQDQLSKKLSHMHRYLLNVLKLCLHCQMQDCLQGLF